MGTSKSISTPSGGDWSSLKQDITSQFGSGTPRCTPTTLVGRTVRAAGGVGTLSSTGASGQGHRRGKATPAGSAQVSRTVSGLGAFGASVAAQGLGKALERLGLGELRDRPAAEVVARIAEHLSSHVDGLDRPLLSGALRDSLLEVSNLHDDVEYQNLAESLEFFLKENGVEGLVETFVANLVYDQVWFLVEQWVFAKSESNPDSEALRASVESACRQLVRSAMSELKKEGRFDSVSWFGADGVALAGDIVQDVESRLNGAANEGA